MVVGGGGGNFFTFQMPLRFGSFCIQSIMAQRIVLAHTKALWRMLSRVPARPSRPGSLVYGHSTKIMDWIETKICRSVLELGIHRSVGLPVHVLIRLRQTECGAGTGGLSLDAWSVVEEEEGQAHIPLPSA